MMRCLHFKMSVRMKTDWGNSTFMSPTLRCGGWACLVECPWGYPYYGNSSLSRSQHILLNLHTLNLHMLQCLCAHNFREGFCQGKTRCLDSKESQVAFGEINAARSPFLKMVDKSLSHPAEFTFLPHVHRELNLCGFQGEHYTVQCSTLLRFSPRVSLV